MRISLILSHPSAQSLCGALALAARDALLEGGHAVNFHHLDAEGFDPRLAEAELRGRVSEDALVEQHCGELAECDGVVVVHPNWWSQPPALLKGWLDRVVRPGVAYEFRRDDAGRSLPVGLLRARAAVVINTANVPAGPEDLLEALWRHDVFPRCGVNSVHREVFAVVASSTAEQRAAWLARTGALVRSVFPRI